MKKIFYLASIAALAFSSCAKDETTEAQINAVNGGAKITAAMAADDTRTSLEKVDGKYEFRWSAGDQLGVYGVGGGLNNAAFVLNNDSDGQAVGVFASQSTELKADKKYVAVYPRFQTSLFNTTLAEVELTDPGKTTKSKYIQLEDVVMAIPAVQKYQPETFYTQTVPAVSTNFTVDANGGAAEVSMQPVVDYLFVNIKSTEPIETLKLTMMDGTNGTADYNLAGKGKLERYALGGEYRFMLNEITEDASTSIVLEMDESSDAVTCHKPNTYVFTVPAGILGMGGNVKAYIYVNDAEAPTYVLTNATGQDNYYTNAQLNGYATKTGTLSRMGANGPAMRLENTIFWANALDKNGERTSFEYNPNEVFIIQNEVDFLQYMYEYEDGGKLGADSKAMGKDAFVCSEYEFDFSNVEKMATLIEAEYLRTYLSDYMANGMPCIKEYKNNFIGNGATLKAITKLQRWFGLFGDITGTINDITFEDIEAAEVHPVFTRATSNIDAFNTGLSVLLGEGVILGSVDTDNEKANNINKVTVKNAKGGAVFTDATVAAFNGVTFDGVSGLDFAAFQLKQNADLDMTKTWDSVKGVSQNVFGGVYAVKNAKEDGHHVITIAKGGDAEYKKLAAIIHVEGTGMDIEYVVNAIVNSIVNNAGYPLAYIVAALAESCEDFDEAGYADWVNDGLATSVVIEGVSYWTGDYIATTPNAEVTTHTQYDIAYAEQLAIGLPNFNAPVGSVYVLQSDINLNFENNYTLWEMANIGNYNTLDGNKKTISGFVMEVCGVSEVAPFSYAKEIKDLTVNGVDINIETKDSQAIAVPSYIAGLVNNTNVLTNVVVNDINFDAYDVSGGFNSEDDPYYAPNKQPVIGWVASYIQDSANVGAQVVGVKANVTSSNLKGISGLIGHLDLGHVTESYFENCALTGNIAQEAIEDFIPVISLSSNPVDAAGTMVAFVRNNIGNMSATSDPVRSIKFNGCGAPVFIYNAGMANDDNKINVLYNDKLIETLLGVEE